MSTPTAKPKRSTRIRWDEETIAKHDQERGTRQRIDEPPTPYHYSSQGGGDDDSVYGSSPATSKPGQNLMDQMEQLQARLNFEHLRQQQTKLDAEAESGGESDGRGSGVHFDDTSSEKSWHSSRSEEDEEKFRRKRQQHYNEFQVLKAWRQRYSDEEDEFLDADELANGHENGQAAEEEEEEEEEEEGEDEQDAGETKLATDADQPEMVFEAEEA